MEEHLKELLKECPKDEYDSHVQDFQEFFKLFKRYLDQKMPSVQWEEITPLTPKTLLDYNSILRPDADTFKYLLDKLVVIKLNGGLGTTMKCDGPKSLIHVRSGLTFLDLTIRQIEDLNTQYNANVPLVLMNSFNTNEATEKELRMYQNLKTKIYTFMQSRYPRIRADNYSLLPNSCRNLESYLWYPPGHGNFYNAFHQSGLIKSFMDEGREYCFLSNIDNLGATVDFSILNSIINPTTDIAPDFMMEVTKKTSNDIKGGTLICWKEKVKLLEYAEVPENHIDDFKSMAKFKVFNTNNLWIKLESIVKMLQKHDLSLDIIENKKKIMVGEKELEIIQLETASGAAIQYFNQAFAVVVPRSRFLPVKSSSDLFLIKSNVYVLGNGNVTMNPLRPFSFPPRVKFVDDHFKSYRDIEKRFQNMPDCKDLIHLTIAGDVTFGKNVTLKGDVIIVANNGEKIDIPKGSVLQ
ncbi:UTP--glucose-1-phosphate uridylyltransferase, partial [Stegodyphus mimosarum]